MPRGKSAVSRGDKVPSLFLVSLTGAAGLEDRNDTAATVANIRPEMYDPWSNVHDDKAFIVLHSIVSLSASTRLRSFCKLAYLTLVEVVVHNTILPTVRER